MRLDVRAHWLLTCNVSSDKKVSFLGSCRQEIASLKLSNDNEYAYQKGFRCA